MEDFDLMGSHMTTLAVFLIVGLSVGVPALIYSARVAYISQKNGGRLSVFLVFLLLGDSLQSALSVPVAMLYLNGLQSISSHLNVGVLVFIFLGLHYCGLYFHQLVALESVSFLRFPLYTSQVFSVPCSVSLSLFVLVQVGVSLGGMWDMAHFSLALPPVAALIVTLVLCARAGPRQPHVSGGDTKSRWRACVVSMVTMALYVPFIVACLVLIIKARSGSLVHEGMGDFLKVLPLTWAATHLRLILDAVLCVFVCKSYRLSANTETGPRPPHDSVSHL